MLTINNNVMALTASNNLLKSYGQLGKSIDALSSGLRVKSAADDAAGLAVRESFRADIAALNQGVRNVNDAYSMLQIMDGAAAVINEKLIRLKELAEQAATGTYSQEQRAIMQQEFDQMRAEIDRIANSTSFNSIKLLNIETRDYGPVDPVRTVDLTGTNVVAGAVYTISIGGVDYNYTARATDTTISHIAAGLAAQINSAAEFTASASGAVVSITEGAGDNDITTSVTNSEWRTLELTGGPPSAGRRYLITIDGAEFSITASASDTTLSHIATRLASAINTDPAYTAHADGAFIAITAGAQNATIEAPTDIERTIEVVGPLATTPPNHTYTITIGATSYSYPQAGGDTLNDIAAGLHSLIVNDYAAATLSGAVITIPEGNGVGTLPITFSNDVPRTVGISGPPPITGRIYRVTIDGTNYNYTALASDTTLDHIATGLASQITTIGPYTASSSGTDINIQGAGAAVITASANIDRTILLTSQDPSPGGITYTINIAGTNFSYTSLVDQDLSNVATELRNRINAHPAYTASAASNQITITSGASSANISINAPNTATINDPFLSTVSSAFSGNVSTQLSDDPINISGSPPAVILVSDINTVGALTIHFGTNNRVGEDFYNIETRDMTIAGLGLDNVIITNQEDAQAALEQINDAIAKKDEGRAIFGTMMNRLENTATVLTLQAENLQAAESRISDVDVAKEMTRFMSLQIKSQAATAILSQANVMPQMALQLLGG